MPLKSLTKSRHMTPREALAEPVPARMSASAETLPTQARAAQIVEFATDAIIA